MRSVLDTQVAGDDPLCSRGGLPRKVDQRSCQGRKTPFLETIPGRPGMRGNFP
jgi:hypothetical protein